MEMYDFSGYATKYDVPCADGRTILPGCFAQQDKSRVTLVWQHNHSDIENALGHADLEAREDGIYAYVKCANTPKGKMARTLVQEGHINSMSIWANELVEELGAVSHGAIKEISLVLAPANPGALIDNPRVIAHSDSGEEVKTTDYTCATIYFGEPIKLEEGIAHADDQPSDEKGKSLQEIFDSMDEDQKRLLYIAVGAAVEEPTEEENKEEPEKKPEGEAEHSVKEGEDDMNYNLFEQKEDNKEKSGVISHDVFSTINDDAKKIGSLKQSFLAHGDDLPNGMPGVDYGVANLELLFPDYQMVRSQPDWIKRDDAWVSTVINGTNKTPFSRIKTMTVDVTADPARARGYRKGHLKKEEVIKFAKRTTDATTIYKKQRMDRDDIIDITSMDIVAFLKQEMQMMLREEIARAILVGDGRSVEDEDHIDETKIRPIAYEDELYSYDVDINMTGANDNEKYMGIVDQIALAMDDYKGSGSPTLFMTKHHHTRLKMVRDVLDRKVFASDADLCDALGVGRIVEVPVLEGRLSRHGKPILGIIVNLADYTIGTNRGGQTNFFDDFDIDYNQYKYLYETRMSGALTRVDSAVVLVEAETPDLDLEVAPLTGATGLGEVKASELQDKVHISDTGTIDGVLKYKANFTEFSKNKDLQNGHYLCLSVKNNGTDQTAEIYFDTLGGGSKDAPKKVTDGKVIAFITDEMAQKCKVTLKGKSGTKVKVFNLSGLRLADAE